jgi:hypothetical protein
MQNILNKLHKFTSAQEPRKVEFSAIDDFTKKYNSTLDELHLLGNNVIDALEKAEIAAKKFQDASKKWEDVYAMGAKLESMAKDLGIDLEATDVNKIEIAKRSSKSEEAIGAKVLGYINQAYNAF